MKKQTIQGINGSIHVKPFHRRGDDIFDVFFEGNKRVFIGSLIIDEDGEMKWASILGDIVRF